MLKYLNSKHLLMGASLCIILIIVGGIYFFKHLENEKTLEKERNIRLSYKQWHLPEGVKARIGSGYIRQMQYSPDGTVLAVVSDIGVWILNPLTAEPLQLLAAHTGVINSISFSPDGKTLAIGSKNGTARLWDISTGEYQKTFTKRDYFFGVDTVFFMPDGRTLAVIHASILDLWDVATGQLKNTLSTDENDMPEKDVNKSFNIYMGLGGYNHSFSSDGKTIASDSEDDSFFFFFWDVATRKEIRRIEVKTAGELLSFSSDLQTLAIASKSRKSPRSMEGWAINVLDVNTQTQKKITETADYGIPFLVFSPDSSFLASYFDRAIHIWDVNTGKEKKRLKVHKSRVSAVAFSPDNRTLVSTSHDSTLRFWNVETGKDMKTVTGYGGIFRDISLSADGERLMRSGFVNRNIQLWNTNTGKHAKNLIGCNEYVDDAVFSSDGSILASSSVLKSTIFLWDVSTGELNKLQGPRRHLSGIAFSRDGETLASWGLTGKRREVIQFWNTKTGRIQRTLQLTKNYKFGASSFLYFDKKMFACAGYYNPKLFVWNLVTGDYQITDLGSKDILESNEIHVAQFSPDGRVFASVFGIFSQRSHEIVLRDVKTGDHIRTLTGHTDNVKSIAFSPDSKTLASGGEFRDGTIRLWNMETGSSKVVTDPSWTESQQKFEAIVASALAFSPDGQTLASGMKSGDIYLWHSATGTKKKKLHGHSGSIAKLYFSADGQTLISASDDLTVLIWDITQ